MTEFHGKKRYIGVRNSRVAERINNNGVDLVLRTETGQDKEVVVRAYVGLRKRLTFTGGRFFVSFV